MCSTTAAAEPRANRSSGVAATAARPDSQRVDGNTRRFRPGAGGRRGLGPHAAVKLVQRLAGPFVLQRVAQGPDEPGVRLHRGTDPGLLQPVHPLDERGHLAMVAHHHMGDAVEQVTRQQVLTRLQGDGDLLDGRLTGRLVVDVNR